MASEPETQDIEMYGLRVRTEIELRDWPEPSRGEPQVHIRAEPSLPADLDAEPYTGRSIFAEGEVHVEVRGVGRYTATGGACIRVSQEQGARPEDVRLYLTGAMFGLLLHQRSVFSLHASCVAVDGKGLAFAAASGSGKSTLVAALLGRGATFVSDDICALAPQPLGAWKVWPGAARVKLDEAGMAAFDHPSGDAEPAGGDRGKYLVRLAAGPRRTGPVPLLRVYLLGYGEGEPRVERISGLEAISALVDETYLLASAVAMGRSAQIFESAAALSRTLEVSRLIRPRGFAHMDAVLDVIERDVRSAGAERA